ncbi:hypothetical protein HRbin25_00093 [bacterium HR25]|jgi:hypothetical protein|nr:hypothetical protein HRbin25_00093 [bacterium HR25]
MAKDALAEFIVRQLRTIVQPESDVELLDVEGGVARILYRRGYNPECPECVMSADDLRAYLLELFAEKAPHIRDVQLDVVEQGQPAS